MEAKSGQSAGAVTRLAEWADATGSEIFYLSGNELHMLRNTGRLPDNIENFMLLPGKAEPLAEAIRARLAGN